MKNISQAKTLGIPTILPPLPLQQEFTRRVESIDRLKVTQRESLAQLNALFASSNTAPSKESYRAKPG